jgi:pimeloyl-ACP methyl ester carboxylesterase
VVVYGALYLAACGYLAYQYVHPSRQRIIKPNWVTEVNVPGEKGDIPTWSSPRLAAKHGKPIVFVLAHGYGGTRESWTDIMSALPKLGFECVAPSMPGQDASPDQSVGFGYPEARTVTDTVKWVRTRYPKPPKIVLLGVSMGGAACWLASEEDPTVDAVVTEGAYARFDETMTHWLDRTFPGGSIYLRPMIWMASVMAHVNPSDIVPVNSAAKWRKPALVIQGGSDTLITMSHAVRLSKAAHCPLWVVPNAEHAQCYEVAKTEYLKKLAEIANRL